LVDQTKTRDGCDHRGFLKVSLFRSEFQSHEATTVAGAHPYGLNPLGWRRLLHGVNHGFHI
jgi:hypothetical protein